MYKLLIGLLLSTTAALAQPPAIEWAPKLPNPVDMPLDDAGQIRFQQVVQSSQPKSQVMQRVGTWAAKFYGSTPFTVQPDTTQGTVVINARLPMKQGAPVNHQLVVETKPGRYRATVDQLAYQYEFTTPIKATKTYPIHPYGLTAQEWYDIYGMMGAQSATTLTGYKKMAINSANSQDAILADLKQRVEAMLDSLQKSVNENKEW